MSPEGIVYTLKNENIESLRRILEHEQKRSISTDEAQNTGESLIRFFSVLADDEPLEEE